MRKLFFALALAFLPATVFGQAPSVSLPIVSHQNIAVAFASDGSAEVVQSVPDVDNPGGVGFTASPDHAAIDSYELDILRPDGTVLQTLSLGKPVPDANNFCTAPLNVQPVKFGTGYSLRVRALAGGAASPYALSENKFNRVPGSPSKVKIGG